VALLAERFAKLTTAAGDEEEFIHWLLDFEAFTGRHRHLWSFLACVSAADARDESIQRDVAAADALSAEVEKLSVALEARLGALTDSAFERLVSDARLSEVHFALVRRREEARYAMPLELEKLAADLSVTGLRAWGRLYDQVSGTLSFTLEAPGEPARELPVSMVRSLLGHADPGMRKAALEGGNRAWRHVAGTVAACLNAISGTRLMLYKRRGVPHFLAPALLDACIQRSTLDALLAAVRARQKPVQHFLHAKARFMGKERLGFQDLEAPLPLGEPERVSWQQGSLRVLDAFGAYPELQRFAQRALEQRWVDHEPRDGKRPGGFCTSSPVIDESRVFMTFAGAAGDVSTLAHELGHAFHNHTLKGLRPWQRSYPMTLAETASIFAEQLLTEAQLKRGQQAGGEDGRNAELRILDTRLSDAVAFTLNIPMRFDFEVALYDRRAEGELSVSELEELMLHAQRTNFGDALAAEELDPLFWASKLHFYITGVSFYNFPYTFGYLFARGLFARYLAQGPSFFREYEALLRQTGSGSAEDVVRRTLGVDLGRPEFWLAALDLVEREVERFDALTQR
jgi:oligoendopeptidase F